MTEKYKILDTSIVLEYPNACDDFKPKPDETLVMVMPGVVIDEMGHQRKLNLFGNGRAATDFFRWYEKKYAEKKPEESLSTGITIGERVQLRTMPELEEKIRVPSSVPFENRNDYIIIQLARALTQQGKETELITFDLEMLMKAHNHNVSADTWRDRTVSEIYQGWQTLAIPNHGVYKKIERGFAPEEFNLTPQPNEYVVLQGPGVPLDVFRYDAGKNKMVNVKYGESERHTKVSPRNPRQRMLMDALRVPDIAAVFIIGSPGTGKTMLSVDAAVEQTFYAAIQANNVSENPSSLNNRLTPKEQARMDSLGKLLRQLYRKVEVTKPMREVPGEVGLGALPGDTRDKLQGRFRSVHDQFGNLFAEEYYDVSKDFAQALNEFILDTPLEFLDGVSMQRTFWIIDEAQKYHWSHMHAIITRLGQGVKAAINGDPMQLWEKRSFKTTALVRANELMKGSPNTATVVFGPEDCERSNIVKEWTVKTQEYSRPD